MSAGRAELDAAIVAYREDPTEANHARLLELQRSRVDAFYRRNAAEYIERTR